MSIYLAVFGKPRYLGLVDMPNPAPKAGQWIVIKTVRGMEMGLLGGALSQEQEAKYRSDCLEEPGDDQTRGPEPMLQEVEFVESAGEVQLHEYCLRRSDEDDVLVRSRQLLKEHQLQMKLVDVEYTMDRKKLFFYFTSEQRIDFRAYVRDLAREFRIRIEMRQIGVRDEAKTVRGISPCGRPCCCSYWLHRFTPINIRMVKEQNLALNPTKISGICGRLMCCMAYEHVTYSALWKSLPSPGSKIKTAQGNYVLEGVDLQADAVRVRFPEGREVPIAIAEFAEFRETVLRGDAWETEMPEEPTRRSSSPPRKPQPLSSGGKSSSSDNFRDESAKLNKKFKPEKISIEEHIAVRTSEKRGIPGKTEEKSGSGEKESTSSKRRSRRRKSGTTSAALPSADGAPTRSADRQADSSGKEQPARRREPLRPRPSRAPAGESPIDPAPVQKEQQENGEKRGGYRRRPRRRPAGGNPSGKKEGEA